MSGTPWKPASWRPTGPSAARPSGPAPRGGGSRYCPPSDGGRIEWPAADDAWFANTIRGDGPGQGPAVPFTATQVVICRYGLAGTLVGAGVVTDAAAVRRMQDTVNAATHVESSAECRIEEGTYVFFTAGTRAAFFTFDLTGCDAWMMPQGVVLPASFARDLRRFS